MIGCQNTATSDQRSTVKVVAAKMTQQTEPSERKYTLAERELEYLMVIWPGEYDNVEQLTFDQSVGKSNVEEGGHLRIHSFIDRVDLPAFGEYVLYVEETKNDDPKDIYRQCIYELIADDEKQGIQVKVHHFKNPKSHLSLGQGLPFSKDLKPGSDILELGCELMLRREGMAYVGKTIAKDCLEDQDNKGITIDYQVRISEEEYWFREQRYRASGKELLSEDQQLAWYNLEKARCFVCMIDFPRKEGGRPVETKHYIKIHDQGGKFEFDYKDGRHMVLGMRNTWSFGMQRETFVIFIQEGSQEGPTLIYSWGAPGADRIGFNPGWIRVQCDLDTPKNVELQQRLRPDS